MKSFVAATAAAPLIAATLGAGACDAGDITYKINQPVGAGAVVGTIVTDGATGVLAKKDIVSWNLSVTGVGASTNLTSAGGSAVVYEGGDLTATPTKLKFNFSGSDSGFLLFQATSPGLFSGARYYCDNTTNFTCAAGASVVPESISDPSHIFQPESGDQVIGVAGLDDSVLASVLALAQARIAQMLVNNLQANLLLGQNEQVSCGNCGGAGMGFGSFAISGHGRHSLNDEWTVMGGVDVAEYKQRGANVSLNAGFAAQLQFDPAGMGASRPYAAFGLSGSLQNTRYSRTYDSNVGVGSTRNYDVGAFGQVGWVARLSRRDELAGNVSYQRTWQIVGGYAEQISNDNPIAAVAPGGTDILDTASLNAQYTHLFGHYLEADLNGGIDWAFNSKSGLRPDIGGFQVTANEPSFVYYQVGGRLGVRVSRACTVDLFVNGIVAPKAIGSSVHGGFGARWSF
jgi:hypothetical protein